MTNLSEVIHTLPAMKSGQGLISALEVLPEYNPAICTADVPVRLMALSDLYRIYVPSQMSLEIYSKLYLALLRSLQKKGTKLTTLDKGTQEKQQENGLPTFTHNAVPSERDGVFASASVTI